MDKVELGRKIKQRRIELNMTQGDIAKSVGVAISTIQRYEAGAINKIKLPVVEAIARAIHVSPEWLCGKSSKMIESSSVKYFPPQITENTVTFYPIGDVAAGYDKIAYEDYDNEPIEIPVHYLGRRPQSDYFILTVHGNSMYPAFMDGDKVLVLKQSTLNRSGDIGVVLYEGENATLKKVEYVMGEDWMKLTPINPEYAPKTITGAALEECRVLGIPKLLIRSF